MKLYGVIAIHVRGEELMRNPRFLDKVRLAFGGRPDLRSGRMRASIESAAIVDSVRGAMQRIGASNAVSLVIDDTVLFHDTRAEPDDLGDLFLAFHDNASVFGAGFDELRLAFEHHEGDLHLVAEVQARSEHVQHEPAVRVVVSGRIDALTPRAGEDADAFRSRAEPIATNRQVLEMYELQFRNFVERLRDALAGAMPTARVEIAIAEPRVVRPGPEPREPAPRASPHARDYDPYDAYYPSPLAAFAPLFLWSTLFSVGLPHHMTVVDTTNHTLGSSDDAGIDQATWTSDDTAWWSDDTGRSADAGSDGGWWDNFPGGLDGLDGFD
ncbi:MAG: hypothetical protein KF773_38350 [Deltaproteobacteria bacterium]|nr:hypothetical protein [Deltaproteobacteria bacterium]